MATDQDSNNVEKYGYLKIKRPPTSGKVRIKAWQSKYFVLRDLPPAFEYFKDELSFRTRSSKEKNQIHLEDVIHIGTTDGSKTQRNAFMIVDKHGALMLAADTEQDTNEWVEALKRVAMKVMQPPNFSESTDRPTARLSLPNTSLLGSPALNRESLIRRGSAPPIADSFNKGYPVTTRLTPSSEKNGLRDDYVMQITDEHVVLHRTNSQSPVVAWPLVSLRAWKNEPAGSAGRRGTQLLTLESGRKSATGEGLFQFFTNFGDQIAFKIRTHSNILWASAAEKRELFKHQRSTSVDDLHHSSLTEERKVLSDVSGNLPVSFKDMPIESRSRLFSLPIRPESHLTFSFDKGERQNLSPALLKKGLLTGIHPRDITAKDMERSSEVLATNSEERQPDHAYLDLICEKDVQPVHISLDSCKKRNETLTNSKEFVSSKCQNPVERVVTPDNNHYIDDSQINVYSHQHTVSKTEPTDKAVQSMDATDNGDGSYSDPKTIQSPEVRQPVSGSNTPFFCQDFFAQLSNPTAHQSSIFSSNMSQDKPILQAQNTRGNNETIEGDSSQTNEEDDALAGESRNYPNHVTSIVTCPVDFNRTVTVSQSNDEKIKSPPSGKRKLCRDNSMGKESSEELDNYLTDKSQSNDLTQANVTQALPPGKTKKGEHILLHRSDQTRDLLQKFMTQIETPQSCTEQELFPPLSKRNSTGYLLDTQRTKYEKLNKKSLPFSSDSRNKKIIEKSKSYSGFEKPVLPPEKPPPVPARPETIGNRRGRTSSASLGDIFENIKHTPDFPQRFRRQLSPLGSRSPSFGASCGPGSLVKGAVLHRSTSSATVQKEQTIPNIRNQDNQSKLPGKELDNRSRSRSLLANLDLSSNQNDDEDQINDDEYDPKKRRGSKASKMLHRVINFTLHPVSTKRRASCGFDAETRGRINEAWSPESSLDVPTPEVSPQLLRRRASHDVVADRKQPLVFDSPTIDNLRVIEETRQKALARERERERSELPHNPPPALPPRKKSDPPPLPPRMRKTSSENSCPSSPPNQKFDFGSSNEASMGKYGLRGCEEGSCLDSPPPVPPRREERRGSQPPSIHLTTSSPENKQDDNRLNGLPEKPWPTSSVESEPGSTQRCTKNPIDCVELPQMARTLNTNCNISYPVPKRPPKNNNRTACRDCLDASSNDEYISVRKDFVDAESNIPERTLNEMQTIENMKGAFISIEIQENKSRSNEMEDCGDNQSQVGRLEISQIEQDSIIDSNMVSLTMRVGPREPRPLDPTRDDSQQTRSISPRTTDNLSPQLSTGSLGSKSCAAGRCSPGHTPPLTRSKPARGGVLVDSGSTTPISV